MGCVWVPREPARARPWAVRTAGQTGKSWTADLLPEFILRARRKPEGAEVGAGRSQGWGLGGLGGKSRAGQDGQVRGPGSPGRESGTSGWGRQYHLSWPQSPQSPLGSRPQRSEPSRTLPSHRPHGFLSQPPAPLTPRNLVNPSGAPPPGPPWHGGVGVGRCEWGLLGEASPQPYTE